MHVKVQTLYRSSDEIPNFGASNPSEKSHIQEHVKKMRLHENHCTKNAPAVEDLVFGRKPGEKMQGKEIILSRDKNAIGVLDGQDHPRGWKLAAKCP